MSEKDPIEVEGKTLHLTQEAITEGAAAVWLKTPVILFLSNYYISYHYHSVMPFLHNPLQYVLNGVGARQ